MNLDQRTHAYSFLISLGMVKPPKPQGVNFGGYINNDKYCTNKAKNSGHDVGEEKRQLLFSNIGEAFKESIIEVKDIWAFILQKEADTGQEILIRNRSGGLMSLATFRDYVMVEKRKTKVKKPSIRDQILDLYRQKFTEPEIKAHLNCSNEHIHRCLVEAGFKQKIRRPYKSKNSLKVC